MLNNILIWPINSQITANQKFKSTPAFLDFSVQDEHELENFSISPLSYPQTYGSLLQYAFPIVLKRITFKMNVITFEKKKR